MIKQIETETGTKTDKTMAYNFTGEIMGIGNCGAVKAEIQRSRKHSVPNVFGIIDWDKSNNNFNYCYQMINNQFYSLDNIILNPYLFIYYLCTQHSNKKENKLTFRINSLSLVRGKW